MSEYARVLPPAEGFASPAVRSRIKAEDVEETNSVAVGLKADVALYPAAETALKVEELEKLFYNAAENGVKGEDVDKALYIIVESGIMADKVLSLTIGTGLKLLASFGSCSPPSIGGTRTLNCTNGSTPPILLARGRR